MNCIVKAVIVCLLAAPLMAVDAPVVITMRNSAPVINEDAGVQLLEFSVANARDADGKPRFDSMSIYPAESDFTSVFYALEITYTPGNSYGYILLVAGESAWGTYTIILFGYDSVSQSVVAVTTFILTITEVNDVPILSLNEPLPVGTLGSATYSLSSLNIRDDDQFWLIGSTSLVITVVTPPEHGELRLSGTPLTAGGRFTTRDIKLGLVSYRNHDGDGDRWQFTWTDGIAPEQGPAWATIWVGGRARPALFSLDNAFTWQESPTPLAFAGRVEIEDGDSPTMSGGSIIVRLFSSSSSGDYLAIANLGSGDGQVAVDGAQVSYGGTVIGTWSGGDPVTPLMVALTGSACTPTAVQAVVRALRFGNQGGNPQSFTRRIEIVVNDGDAGASAPLPVQIAVRPMDDPPVIASRTIATVTDQARPVQFTVADPDSTVFAWSVARAPTMADLTVLDAAQGRFRLVPHPGEAGVDSCAVSVHSDNYTVVLDVPIAIVARNDPRLLPLADPPREAVAGQTLAWRCPWQAQGTMTGPLEVVAIGDIPTGLVAVMEGDEMVVEWPVPAAQALEVHHSFLFVVQDGAGSLAGVLPWNLLVVPGLEGGG